MTDLSTWLTESETAERLGWSTRTLRRKCMRGEGPEKRQRQIPGRSPEPVFNPEDVATLATHAPVVVSEMPGQAVATRGQTANSLVAPGSPLDRFLEFFTGRLQAAPPSPPAHWVDLKAASARTGLSVRMLRRLIRVGRLKSILDRRTKVLEADLDGLDSTAIELATVAKLAKARGGLATVARAGQAGQGAPNVQTVDRAAGGAA